MANSSLLLIVLLALFIILYRLFATQSRMTSLLLFIFGLLVYGWGNFARVIILVSLLFINYLYIKFLYRENAGKRKIPRCFLVGFNIFTWLFFKFECGQRLGISEFSIPIGMSFYILRLVSYTTLAHKTTFHKRSGDFLSFALYVSFFPQVFSGPIEDPAQFIKQISTKKHLSQTDVFDQFSLIIMGLFKKIVIADNLRVVVDRIFQLNAPGALIIYIGTCAFIVQLFCDFSGYTDISRGVAGLLGFETDRNFNNPVLSLTPSDFWNRWHMSLTAWLRVNIFFPIQRYFKNKDLDSKFFAQILPVMLTMLFSGFWHGNQVKYLLWGFYHGVLLLIFHYSGIDHRVKKMRFAGKIAVWLATSQLMLLGWVVFRASSVDWVMNIFTTFSLKISAQELVVAGSLVFQTAIFCSPLFLHFFIINNKKFAGIASPIFYAASAVILVIFSASGVQEFIYFGF